MSNRSSREFTQSAPNHVRITDITYGTGFNLAVVLDLFSRRVIGWTMKSTLKTDLVLDALLRTVWRRRPIEKVLIHSDQGVQYASCDWQTFLKDHNLEASMSRKGNCHDNAVAESFFSLLKKDRVRRKSTEPEMMLGPKYSIILKASIIQDEIMVQITGCLQSKLKDNILRS